MMLPSWWIKVQTFENMQFSIKCKMIVLDYKLNMIKVVPGNTNNFHGKIFTT